MKRRTIRKISAPLPNKYRAQKTVFNGRRYDSKFEAIIARDLDLRMKAGEFIEVLPQFKIEITAHRKDGTLVKLFNYICDFRCQLPDGTYTLIEVKGVLTASYRIKKKALQLLWLPEHPDYTFEEIKQSDSRR